MNNTLTTELARNIYQKLYDEGNLDPYTDAPDNLWKTGSLRIAENLMDGCQQFLEEMDAYLKQPEEGEMDANPKQPKEWESQTVAFIHQHTARGWLVHVLCGIILAVAEDASLSDESRRKLKDTLRRLDQSREQLTPEQEQEVLHTLITCPLFTQETSFNAKQLTQEEALKEACIAAESLYSDFVRNEESLRDAPVDTPPIVFGIMAATTVEMRQRTENEKKSMPWIAMVIGSLMAAVFAFCATNSTIVSDLIVGWLLRTPVFRERLTPKIPLACPQIIPTRFSAITNSLDVILSSTISTDSQTQFSAQVQALEIEKKEKQKQ